MSSILDNNKLGFHAKFWHRNKMKQHYIDCLHNINPIDENELNEIQDSVDWIKVSKYIHKPNNMNQHLGVLAYVISTDYSSIFLLNHKKAMMWLPPGGHVDDGLSLNDAVKLEIREELGISAEFYSDKPFFHTRTVTQGINSGHIDVTFWFILLGNSDRNYHVQEKEASEAKWFNIKDILTDDLFKHLHRSLNKLLGILDETE